MEKKEVNSGPILKLLLVDGKDHCATSMAQHSGRGHANVDTSPAGGTPLAHWHSLE